MNGKSIRIVLAAGSFAFLAACSRGGGGEPSGVVVPNNLPPHGALSLEFLFAAIDSLDGIGNSSSDADRFYVRMGAGGPATWACWRRRLAWHRSHAVRRVARSGVQC